MDRSHEPDAARYGRITRNLNAFGPSLTGLLEELTLHAGIQVHSIVYRVKAYESAAAKVAKSPDKYTGIESLTDMLGLRIITYFADEVDAVADMVEREFKVDKENSVDKRATLDPDRFGYLSRHYILSLNSTRADLAEYARFKGEIFELQIRSILQHAWAEIEHDLGYKTRESLPAEMRRQFSRLAGLLELADEQFEALRDKSAAYSEKVQSDIARHPDSFEVNQITVKNLIASNPLVEELDLKVADFLRTWLDDEISDKYSASLAHNLSTVGISNMKELGKELRTHREFVVHFADEWINPSRKVRHKSSPRGICLYYLFLVKMTQLGKEEAVKVVARSNLPETSWVGTKGLLERAFKVYEKVSGESEAK